MEDKPLVSVIIPVYNCERYLAETIESVLAQTYQPLEMILMDDGSTDGSAEVANRFAHSVRYCSQSNGGIGAARNRGADLAQGNFLAFLDADDRWVTDKLERQIEAFDDEPELDAVFGHVRQFISPELDKEAASKILCPSELMPGYIAGAMLIRRSAFYRVGPFQVSWKVGEFIDWYLRAIELGLKMTLLPDLVLWRRLHGANQGIRERQAVTDYVSILKASIDRRRAVKHAKVDR